MGHESILVLGAGGHGSVVADALLSAGMAARGFVDPALPVGSPVVGLPVKGDDAWLLAQGPGASMLAHGIGARPGDPLRSRLFDEWVARGYRFATVRHAASVVGSQVELGYGVQLMAGSVLQCRVRTGKNVVINTGASVDHDCELEEHVFVAPGAVLCGGVRVGSGAFIGAGATVLPGVSIGKAAVVAAGAIVHRNVGESQWVAGNPARTMVRESK
jgi:sugar O-acyltransferase (sialic acid O-acetyltransferase NeuD family)